MWGRLIASLCSFLIVPAFAAAQDNADLKLGVGSKLFWGAADYPYSETILAVKDDFVIYVNEDFDSNDPAPDDYYVMFSGLYFETCGAEMPTDEERAALAAFRPFKVGATLSSDMNGGTTFEVVDQVQTFLMGKEREAYRLKISFDDKENGTETVDVLKGLPLNTRISYEDAEVYKLMLVTRSEIKDVPHELVGATLGNCANLITQ